MHNTVGVSGTVEEKLSDEGDTSNRYERKQLGDLLESVWPKDPLREPKYKERIYSD